MNKLQFKPTIPILTILFIFLRIRLHKLTYSTQLGSKVETKILLDYQLHPHSIAFYDLLS